MNNTNKSIKVSISLSGERVLNEGSEPVSRYWNFVRSYFEIDNSGKSTNKCKDTDEGENDK